MFEQDQLNIESTAPSEYTCLDQRLLLKIENGLVVKVRHTPKLSCYQRKERYEADDSPGVIRCPGRFGVSFREYTKTHGDGCKGREGDP